MKLLLLCPVVFLAIPIFGWIPKRDMNIWSNLYGTYESEYEDFGIGQLLESFADLGYKDDIIGLFNKTKKHLFCLNYTADGKGSGQIDITNVVGNIERVNKDVKQRQEYQELLFDDRKAKTTMIFDHPDDYTGDLRDITFHKNIIGGSTVVVRYRYKGDGYVNVSTEVKGKPPTKYYVLRRRGEYSC